MTKLIWKMNSGGGATVIKCLDQKYVYPSSVLLERRSCFNHRMLSTYNNFWADFFLVIKSFTLLLLYYIVGYRHISKDY